MKFTNFGRRNDAAAELAVGSADATSQSDHVATERQMSEKDLGRGEGKATALDDDDNDVVSPTKAPSPDATGGVKKIEAVTLSWTKKDLIVAYACIFLVFFVISMGQQTQFNLTVYVTSSFSLLPLTATTSIVSSIVGGVFKLPTARFIDIVGRAEGFVIMTSFAVIGLILMAACKNVETYMAAQVFYWVGFNGMAYVMDVFMADTSSLKNRAFTFAFSTTPYIATTFIGPRAAESFLETSGWPWGYGTYAIVIPVAVLPLLYVLFTNQIKAKKAGLLVKEKSGRTTVESIEYYFFEFDVIGLILIIGGFSVFLLGLSLASYARSTYSSPQTIAMCVVGIVSLIVFAIYEATICPKTFVPWLLMKDRSVIGACLLSAFLFVSFYLWDSYFNNYLQAVHGLSVTNAGYVYNIYSIGSCFWAVVLAGMIRFFGSFKYLAMAHLCLQLLGVGLMIHFRQPNIDIGYVVMTQIFISFGGGGTLICEDMAVMAASPHQNVAVSLALIGLFSSVGGAIGSAIATSVYTAKFPAALDRALPGNATLNAELYSSLVSQLAYPMGSPERDAVIYAYGEAMWYLSIAATVALVPCFVFIAMWRDFKIKDMRTVKGRVV